MSEVLFHNIVHRHLDQWRVASICSNVNALAVCCILVQTILVICVIDFNWIPCQDFDIFVV